MKTEDKKEYLYEVKDGRVEFNDKLLRLYCSKMAANSNTTNPYITARELYNFILGKS